MTKRCKIISKNSCNYSISLVYLQVLIGLTSGLESELKLCSTFYVKGYWAFNEYFIKENPARYAIFSKILAGRVYKAQIFPNRLTNKNFNSK